MLLRDYLYLDTIRLEDYLPRFGIENTQSLRDVRTVQRRGAPGPGRSPQFGQATSQESVDTQSTQERTQIVSAKNLFTQLYDTAEDDLNKIDQSMSITTSSVSRNELVEVTRVFEVSPIHDIIDAMLEIINVMERAGISPGSDQESAEAMAGMKSLFSPNGQQQRDIPLISERVKDDDAAVVFLLHPDYLLRTLEEIAQDQEVTLVGKVQQILPPGSSLDLVELLKVLPRSMRRGRGVGGSFRDVLASAFSNAPDTIGGSLSADDMLIAGPAVVIAPLAIFN